MKARSGQVALYLAMTIVVIVLLTLTNVSAYLAVTAKNRAMNAGDAAALAVAGLQGELLNRIGELNVRHLQTLIDCTPVDGETPEEAEARRAACREECAALYEEQARLCFLGPLRGISAGNEAARQNGAEKSDEMAALLKQHVADVRRDYVNNPELYPEPWEGAWEEYAQQLELAVGSGVWAGPDNIDFMDFAAGHLLMNRQFYNAIAGGNWCWFHFNAPDVLNSYSSFASWSPLPTADDETRRRRSANCEVYSLGLHWRTGAAREVLGGELLERVADRSREQIARSDMIDDPEQHWLCYDVEGAGSSMWRNWWEIDPAGASSFPVVGKVRPEYDVRGCAAICRIVRTFQDVVHTRTRQTSWTAAAKPFGTVAGEDGNIAVVTDLKSFVTPAFAETRLVPIDAVGGKDLATADADWMTHVREHLPPYMAGGPSAVDGGCHYCRQLRAWEDETLRRTARDWLRKNAGTCRRGTYGESGRGGTPHAH